MSPRLPALTAKDVIRILGKAGFSEWRQKGSHLSLYREVDGKALTIPVHFKKDLPKGTLRAIIRSWPDGRRIPETSMTEIIKPQRGEQFAD
jgi:predicted RNA binding protein YcfA (HicA-like mRNA interferase family)